MLLIKLVLDTFFSLLIVLFVFVSSLALTIFMYSKWTKQPFKEVFPTAIRKSIQWLVSTFKTQNNGSQSQYFRMEKEYITPILRALNENCQCVERSCYIFSEVAHYEFQLNTLKELDLNYLERLIQVVFYYEILPLYQIQVGQVNKEDIEVFIVQREKILGVYVGHSKMAHKKISQYRQLESKRKLEKLNDSCGEILE